MARKKQCQNIDDLMQSIRTITKDRCSLPDEDVKILTDYLIQLENLKRKKGKTNKEIRRLCIPIIEKITSFFLDDSTEKQK